MAKSMINRSNSLMHRLDETTENLSKVPFGQLVGGVLTACIQAQSDASSAALRYTKEVLFQDDPSEREVSTITFCYNEGGVQKSLTLPLITVVPIPNLRLDSVDIGFYAEVSVDNRNQGQFLTTIGSNQIDEKTLSTATANSNLHIDITAHSNQIPSGIAALMRCIGDGGIIIEDVPEPEPAPENDVPGYDPVMDPGMMGYPDPAGYMGMMEGTEGISNNTADGEEEMANILLEYKRQTEGQDYNALAEATRNIRAHAARFGGIATLEDIRNSGGVVSYFGFNPGFNPEFNPDDPAGAPAMATPGGTFFEMYCDQYEGLRGLFTHWTAPYISHNPGVPYRMEDYEVISTILSTLLWERYNGPTRMVTDSEGMRYFDDLQITGLWTYGCDASLDYAAGSINPQIFWNADKIIAAREQPAPFALLSNRVLVWQPLFDQIMQSRVAALSETPSDIPQFYPPIEQILQGAPYVPRAGYGIPSPLYDTSLVCFIDPMTVQEFADDSYNYMCNNMGYSSDNVSQMLFADRTLFASNMQMSGAYVDTLCSTPDANSPFTLLWAARSHQDPASLNALCRAMVEVITYQFGNQFSPSPQVQAIFDRYPAADTDSLATLARNLLDNGPSRLGNVVQALKK